MAPSLSGGPRDPAGASGASTTKPCRPEPHMSAKMLTVNMPEAISKTQRCLESFTVVSLHAWEEIGVLQVVLVWAFTIHHKHEAKSRLISVDPQNLMNWPRVPPPLDSLPTMTASPRYFLGLRACTCLGASWALCPDASALPSGAMEWLKHANQSIFQCVSNLNKLKDGWNTTVFCSQGGWKDDLSQRCDSNPQSVHPC